MAWLLMAVGGVCLIILVLRLAWALLLALCVVGILLYGAVEFALHALWRFLRSGRR